MKATGEQALEILERTFEGRLRRSPETGGAVASVLPREAAEIELLAEITGRHSLPLVPVGAGTGSRPEGRPGSLLVRFDLMRAVHLPQHGQEWVEVEPGTPWLNVDDALRRRGMGLTVYPTSAPRTTIGGWVATNGLGVGSFEYGWLSENIVSASVVFPGGERREVSGTEIGGMLDPDDAGGILVGTKLKIRRADGDVLFAMAFDDAGSLGGAVNDSVARRMPFWHLAFISPAMARARNLGGDHLMFGAYPGNRGAAVARALDETARWRHGRMLPVPEARRAWGERFYPVAPSFAPPGTAREFVPSTGLAEKLGVMDHQAAVQGTVTRSGEVLLLTLMDGGTGSASWR